VDWQHRAGRIAFPPSHKPLSCKRHL
jgi:hypothetical protein